MLETMMLVLLGELSSEPRVELLRTTVSPNSNGEVRIHRLLENGLGIHLFFSKSHFLRQRKDSDFLF